MHKRNRATRFEMEKRHEKVIICLRQGISETAIVQGLMDTDGLTYRTACRAVQDANNFLSKPTDNQRDISLLQSRLNFIYTTAIKEPTKDLASALKAIEIYHRTLVTNHNVKNKAKDDEHLHRQAYFELDKALKALSDPKPTE